MSKWVCSQCKFSNNSHAKYCKKCGHFKEGRMIVEDAIKWKCPVCKVENPNHATYCSKCGHWLLSENSMPEKVVTHLHKSAPKTFYKPNTSSSQKGISKLQLVETIIIIILSALIIFSEKDLINAVPYILTWIFIVHLLFSFVYIFKAYLEKGLLHGTKVLLMHGLLLFILLIAATFTNFKQDNWFNEAGGTTHEQGVIEKNLKSIE